MEETIQVEMEHGTEVGSGVSSAKKVQEESRVDDNKFQYYAMLSLNWVKKIWQYFSLTDVLNILFKYWL